MGYPKLIVFMRHAESTGNVRTREQNLAARVAPHAYDLTPRGRLQAAASGGHILGTHGTFDVHYVSTYDRTRLTLYESDIAKAGSGDIIETSLLDEAQFGIWHFHARDELNALFPKERDRQQGIGLYHYRPFGGENWPDIEMRVRMLLAELCRDWSGKKVLLVGHGNYFAAFLRVVERVSIGTMLDMSGLNPVPNCSVVTYRGTGPWYAPWNRTRLSYESIEVPWQGLDI